MRLVQVSPGQSPDHARLYHDIKGLRRLKSRDPIQLRLCSKANFHRSSLMKAPGTQFRRQARG